jgi:hypothetical protein
VGRHESVEGRVRVTLFGSAPIVILSVVWRRGASIVEITKMGVPAVLTLVALARTICEGPAPISASGGSSDASAPIRFGFCCTAGSRDTGARSS